MERRRFRLVPVAFGIPPAVFLVLFFAWPVAAIVARGLSGGALIDLARDEPLRRVAWFTLWQSVASTAATIVAGMPLAFVLARYRFRFRSLVESLLLVPFVLPTVVVGAAFLALFNNRQSLWGVILAHVFFNVPVLVRVVTPLWRQLDFRLGDAARTLGASRLQAARCITLPLLMPALLSAAGIVLLFTFTSFGVVLLVGGPRRRTLEVEIYQRTAQLLDLRGAAALAFLQLVVLGGLLLWSARAQERTAVPQRLSDFSRPGRRGIVVLVLGSAGALFSLPFLALVRRAGHWSQALGPTGQSALALSLRTALLSATVSGVLGACAAIAIAPGGRVSRLLDVGLTLPLGTSAVTVGFGLLITFNRAPVDLRATFILIPLAHAIIGLPFVVRTAVPVLRSINPRQRDAAAMLGASPWQVWLTVDAPVLRRALLAGIGFAAGVSLGEFGATSFLVRRGGPTLPTLIGQLLGRPGLANNQQAYALATVLAATVAVVTVSMSMLNRWIR